MIDPEHRRRVDELCDAALDRDPRERTAFVASACGGDEALRLEVEALLVHAHTGEGFLAAPIGAVAAEVLGDEHGASLVGRQVGVYRIVSHLGTGGMGEVYRARDTTLGRDVAIKVVPQAFTSDPERRTRFEREARMLAALNHPNIGAIYGLEDADGLRGLVLELVDGETLADRIQRGPVPMTEALTMARQITAALDAAHQSGIIHRDLKPANIKITPSGVVKVLDFGLAKAAIGDLASGQDVSHSPTVTMAGTREGVVLGTPAYMSPEQARGQTVDKRTDIWAFGCVQYELLTGTATFRGATLSDTIAAILEREPDWQTLPSSTPGRIRDLLRHCLQKDRTLRLRDIGDARIEIEDALAVPATAQPTSSVEAAQISGLPPTRVSDAQPSRRWAPAFALGLPIVAIMAGLAVWILRPSTSASAPVSRSVFTLPAGEQLAGLVQPAVALSPDGNLMVYVANRAGVQQLHLRSMDSFESKPITGTDGAFGPFFSPDSRWIGFFADGKLKKISVAGGPAVTLGDALGNQFGATWGTDDTIVFEDRNGGGGLGQISVSGGEPQRLTTPDSKRFELTDRWPAFLPGAKALLFNTFSNTPGAALFVALYVRQTGERRYLIQGGATHAMRAPGTCSMRKKGR